MRKALKKFVGVYHIVDGQRVEGVHERLHGDVAGLRGDATGIHGDIDSCRLTKKERTAGVDIADLIVDK